MTVSLIPHDVRKALEMRLDQMTEEQRRDLLKAFLGVMLDKRHVRGDLPLPELIGWLYEQLLELEDLMKRYDLLPAA